MSQRLYLDFTARNRPFDRPLISRIVLDKNLWIYIFCLKNHFLILSKNGQRGECSHVEKKSTRAHTPFVPMWSNCRNSKCAMPGVSTAVLRTFRTSGPSKTGLVTTRRFLADPHHRPWLVRKMQTGPRDAMNPFPLGSRQADNVGTTSSHSKMTIWERLRLKARLSGISLVACSRQNVAARACVTHEYMAVPDTEPSH
jgi:hypothetical protein